MIKKTAFVFSMLTACLFSHSESMNFEKNYSPDKIKKSISGKYTKISYPGLKKNLSEVGSPAIPFDHINVVLPDPAATDIKVTVEGEFTPVFDNITMYPMQMPVVPSKNKTSFSEPNPNIYESDNFYPKMAGFLVGTNEMRGVSFISIKACPFRYSPKDKTLYFCNKLNIKVDYQLNQTKTRSVTPVLPDSFASSLSSIVLNPEAVSDYKASPDLPQRRSGDDCDYLIITEGDTEENNLVAAFQELVNFRIQHNGYTGKVITVSEIVANYSGERPTGPSDPQTAIRNCIRDYVDNKNTLFVVLGGDDTIVPVRACYSAYKFKADDGREYEIEVEKAMPTDLYYACLDSTWDNNINGTYGEVEDSVDMIPDVWLGRIPVRTAKDAMNYINKLTKYEQEQVKPNKTLMAGTELWNTYRGSDRPNDGVNDCLPDFTQHERVSDAEMWMRRLYRDHFQEYGFEAQPLAFLTDTVSTWDRSPGGGDFDANSFNLTQKLNQDWKFMFFGGHGNTQLWSTEWALAGEEDNWYIDSVFDINNVSQTTGLIDVLYTMACLTGHFDKNERVETYYGEEFRTPAEPCLSETFIRKANSGALIYIGGSRFGWGYRDSAPAQNDSDGGTSMRYGQSFFKYLFKEKKQIAGEAFTLHKLDWVANSIWEYSTERWCQFSLNLQGDPAHEILINNNLNGNATLTLNKYSYQGTTSFANQSFPINEEIDIVATPKEGYRFSRWVINNGDAEISDPFSASTKVKIYNDTVIEATFTHSTTLTMITAGKGDVNFPEGVHEIGLAQYVNLIATPEENYIFDHWEVLSGNVIIDDLYSSTTGIYTYSDAILQAAFTPSFMNEDFESLAFPPLGWSTEILSGSDNWLAEYGNHYNFDTPHSGVKNACLFSYRGSQTRLITPPIDLSMSVEPKITFYYMAEESGGDQDELTLYYRTSAKDQWKLVPNSKLNSNYDEWTKFEFILPNPSEEYYIAFEGTANWGYGVCIDDIVISDKFINENKIIIAKSTGSGTITPSGICKVKEGHNIPFTITPGEGYHIKNLYINGEPTFIDPIYTFWNVNKNNTITAEFAQNEYTVSGRVVKSDGTGFKGIQVSYDTYTDDDGYFSLTIPYGRGVTLRPIVTGYKLDRDYYTITSISADVTDVIFTAMPFVITETSLQMSEDARANLNSELSAANLSGVNPDLLADYQLQIANNFNSVYYSEERLQEIVDAVNEGKEIMFYEMHNGWNLVHLPCENPLNIAGIFSHTTGISWSWDTEANSYAPKSTLCAGEGVWLYWNNPKDCISVTSSRFVRDNVRESTGTGWNLIGICDPATMNSRNLLGIWEWNATSGTYTKTKQEDVELGKGYWIFSTQ